MFVRSLSLAIMICAAVASSKHFVDEARAATPAQSCQSAKNKEVGKYAYCRQKAEAKYAVTGDAAVRTAALQKCLDKYDANWPKLESKAAGQNDPCPSTGDQAAIRAAADDYTSNVATALSGGALSSCPANLATCETDVATCQSDLAACQAALSGAPVCGNGTLENGEQCEAGTLNGSTCLTQGFTGGILRCGIGCILDTSGCYTTRFVDNGDGTVTDGKTGLQWEKKTTTVGSGFNYSDPHDVDNGYYLFTGTGWDYMLFSFLNLLNQSFSTDGSMPAAGWTTCFARRCDWRAPTITELKSIIDVTVPGCGTGSPCIDPVFGPTVADGQNGSKYLSWTEPPATAGSFAVTGLWAVDFRTATVAAVDPVLTPYRVRAVRGGRDYAWVVGNWSTCSATCGGGTQTRAVTCQTPLGESVFPTESVCVGAGPKPATQQSCNTNPC